ncbi:MAG: ABC transporter permease [Limnochordia bacterium]|jgi:putative ABC transport system permease protein
MLEAIRFTGRLIKRRPLRTLLTILEIALGTWIMIIVLSLNFQAKDHLAQSRDQYGEHMASLRMVSTEPSDSRTREVSGGIEVISMQAVDMSVNEFRQSDLELLRQSSPLIQEVYVERSTWHSIVQRNEQEYYIKTIVGTTPDYARAVSLRITQGQFFLDEDVKAQNRVILISETIAKGLFGDVSPIGKKLKMRNSYDTEVFEYDIIGVYAPFTTVQSLVFYMEPHGIVPLGTEYFTPTPARSHREETFWEVVIRTDGNIHAAVDDARLIMKQQYGEDVEIEADYFKTRTEYLSSTIKDMTLFFGGFAFVAVIVSAIGILSIMLVSVVERTKEIGLRRCLGASKGSIALWVLTESCMLTLWGSLLGLLVAAFSSRYVLEDLIMRALYGGLPIEGGMHPLAAFVAVVIMLLSGIVFGLYPALQAARLTPVEALKEQA